MYIITEEDVSKSIMIIVAEIEKVNASLL